MSEIYAHLEPQKFGAPWRNQNNNWKAQVNGKKMYLKNLSKSGLALAFSFVYNYPPREIKKENPNNLITTIMSYKVG